MGGFIESEPGEAKTVTGGVLDLKTKIYFMSNAKCLDYFEYYISCSNCSFLESV